MSGDVPETRLFVEPMQDRREVVVEFARDCVEAFRAVQSQEKNVLHREGNVEFFGMRRYS